MAWHFTNLRAFADGGLGDLQLSEFGVTNTVFTLPASTVDDDGVYVIGYNVGLATSCSLILDADWALVGGEPGTFWVFKHVAVTAEAGTTVSVDHDGRTGNPGFLLMLVGPHNGAQPGEQTDGTESWYMNDSTYALDPTTMQDPGGDINGQATQTPGATYLPTDFDPLEANLRAEAFSVWLVDNVHQAFFSEVVTEPVDPAIDGSFQSLNVDAAPTAEYHVGTTGGSWFKTDGYARYLVNRSGTDAINIGETEVHDLSGDLITYTVIDAVRFVLAWPLAAPAEPEPNPPAIDLRLVRLDPDDLPQRLHTAMLGMRRRRG